MPELVSVVALAGWLILAFASYRSYRVSGRTVLTQVLIWVSIFIVVLLVFETLGT